MRVYRLIIKFCEENSDRYSICENYSSELGYCSECLGIVVKSSFSHIEMLIKLTEYMNEADLTGCELEFSEGILVEKVGMDTIVCFPNVKADNKLV